jgi:hypothetical protein
MVSGAPRLAFVTRTHPPNVCREACKEFDAMVLATLQQFAQIEMSGDEGNVTKILSSLPTKKGGLGLTSFLDVAPADYLASREAAERFSAPADAHERGVDTKKKLSEFREAVYTRWIDHIDNKIAYKGPKIQRVQNASTGVVNVMLNTTTSRASPREISAAIRMLLGAPIALPAGVGVVKRADIATCPCGFESTRGEFTSFHAPSCTRVVGENATMRHTRLTQALREELIGLNIHTQMKEPREFPYVQCTLCQNEVRDADWATHAATCPRRGMNGVPTRGARIMRGPDVKFAGMTVFGVESVYVDVSIVSAIDDRRVAERQREKHRHYDADIPQDAKFVAFVVNDKGVFGAEANELINSVADVCKVPVAPLRRRLQLAAFFGSANALANAEAKLGYSHVHASRRLIAFQPVRTELAAHAAIAAAPPRAPAAAVAAPTAAAQDGAMLAAPARAAAANNNNRNNNNNGSAAAAAVPLFASQRGVGEVDETIVAAAAQRDEAHIAAADRELAERNNALLREHQVMTRQRREREELERQFEQSEEEYSMEELGHRVTQRPTRNLDTAAQRLNRQQQQPPLPQWRLTLRQPPRPQSQ